MNTLLQFLYFALPFICLFIIIISIIFSIVRRKNHRKSTNIILLITLVIMLVVSIVSCILNNSYIDKSVEYFKNSIFNSDTDNSFNGLLAEENKASANYTSINTTIKETQENKQTIKSDYSSLNIVIALDRSLSMQDSDPQNISLEAARSFVDMCSQLNGENVKISIISFSGEIVTECKNKKANGDNLDIKNAISELTEKYNEDTDIEETLKTADNILKNDKSNSQKAILILTDGQIDIPKNAKQSRKRVLEGVENGSCNYPIYTIGLKGENKDNYDDELLTAIANGTGGTYSSIDTTAGLIDIKDKKQNLCEYFKSIFETRVGIKAKDSEVIELTNNKTVTICSEIVSAANSGMLIVYSDNLSNINIVPNSDSKPISGENYAVYLIPDTSCEVGYNISTNDKYTYVSYTFLYDFDLSINMDYDTSAYVGQSYDINVSLNSNANKLANEFDVYLAVIEEEAQNSGAMPKEILLNRIDNHFELDKSYIFDKAGTYYTYAIVRDKAGFLERKTDLQKVEVIMPTFKIESSSLKNKVLSISGSFVKSNSDGDVDIGNLYSNYVINLNINNENANFNYDGDKLVANIPYTSKGKETTLILNYGWKENCNSISNDKISQLESESYNNFTIGNSIPYRVSGEDYIVNSNKNIWKYNNTVYYINIDELYKDDDNDEITIHVLNDDGVTVENVCEEINGEKISQIKLTFHKPGKSEVLITATDYTGIEEIVK